MNRERLEEAMYLALSYLLYLWDLEEQRGRGFLKLSYGGKGKNHKQEELLIKVLCGAIKRLPKELHS